MRILVTGGAGFIGTHTLLQLLRQRFETLILDNFSNSSPEALSRVKQLANADFLLREGDIRDTDCLDSAFADFRPEAVIHFAGLKAVGESHKNPLEYYGQNVAGSVALLKAMRRYDCARILFSSSATVYGEAEYLPYDENHRLQPSNPYGRTKYFIEEIIRDWVNAWPKAGAVSLRYFNPVGADGSGRIGEDPSAIPNNLMPFIAQVAVGRLERLNIFGGDYETRDGTGERDYIHVEDLARAHLDGLQFLSQRTGYEAINIGTGTGITVLEMVRAFEKESGKTIPYQIVARRSGDIARSFAAADKAKALLGWEARLGLAAMCQSTWRWQSTNPFGYQSANS